MLIARRVCHLEDLITMRHLENMNKIIVATGTMVGYAYATELFIAYYSGNSWERYAFYNRVFGPYSWAYWTMVSCNVIFPQLFWIKRVRTSIMASFILSIIVNIGMWFERFVIIVSSLANDFIPTSWAYFRPRLVDLTMFAGTFGLFFTMFLLFAKFLPMLAISEVKGVMPAADPHHEGHEGLARGGTPAKPGSGEAVHV
jgi:molybdopterin-containing oxidoreductase family membrane subunit